MKRKKGNGSMIDQITALSKHRDVDYHSSSDNGDKKMQELKTAQDNKD